MRLVDTQAGRFAIGNRDELFSEATAIAARAAAGRRGRALLWGLSGGSTPVDWYRWCVAGKAIPEEVIANTEWFTSDERHVPLSSGESNFGTADRLMLEPLGVPPSRKHPWPVGLPAPECAARFEDEFRAIRADGALDICFLGLGADGHTASLFPGGALVHSDRDELFAAIEVPGKGWRLTITPSGLGACERIVVMTLGAGKREALGRVLADRGSVDETPSRILRAMSGRVTWLVDPPACRGVRELE